MALKIKLYLREFLREF